MNVNQSRLLSFLSRAARGEAEMPPHILDSFAIAARNAMEKHFVDGKDDFTLRMSNDQTITASATQSTRRKARGTHLRFQDAYDYGRPYGSRTNRSDGSVRD